MLDLKAWIGSLGESALKLSLQKQNSCGKDNYDYISNMCAKEFLDSIFN